MKTIKESKNKVEYIDGNNSIDLINHNILKVLDYV